MFCWGAQQGVEPEGLHPETGNSRKPPAIQEGPRPPSAQWPVINQWLSKASAVFCAYCEAGKWVCLWGGVSAAPGSDFCQGLLQRAPGSPLGEMLPRERQLELCSGSPCRPELLQKEGHTSESYSPMEVEPSVLPLGPCPPAGVNSPVPVWRADPLLTYRLCLGDGGDLDKHTGTTKCVHNSEHD